MADLKKGEWAHANIRPEFIGYTADGVWTLPRNVRIMPRGTGSQVAVIHDMAGGWRLLLCRDFEPSLIKSVRNPIIVSHAYRGIRFSRKVKLIYEAPPPTPFPARPAAARRRPDSGGFGL